eukprot:scaffold1821_cov344-Pavlova_lutheri.AAC.53
MHGTTTKERKNARRNKGWYPASQFHPPARKYAYTAALQATTAVKNAAARRTTVPDGKRLSLLTWKARRQSKPILLKTDRFKDQSHTIRRTGTYGL